MVKQYSAGETGIPSDGKTTPSADIAVVAPIEARVVLLSECLPCCVRPVIRQRQD